MILLFIKHLFRVRLDPLIRKGIMSKNNNTYIGLAHKFLYTIFIKYYDRKVYRHALSPFYRTKFSLTNFICQMFFDRINFSTNSSKTPNLRGQKTFDI